MSQGDLATLLAEGRDAEALSLAAGALARGDAAAMLALAQHRLQAQDAGGAIALLERAAQAGSVQATMPLIALLATGTGCAADPGRARGLLERLAAQMPGAAAQLRLLDAPALPPITEELHAAPRVTLLRGAFSPAHTQALRAMAASHLAPSFVVDPTTGARRPHPVRNSSGMSFGPLAENLVVNGVNRRLAALTGTAYACGEPLHVLRYAPGEEYRPHLDALPGVANQRLRTAIVFLNAAYAGGETVFPELGLSIRGEEGDVLVFDNLTADGQPDPRTRHAGLPITAGEKWIATRWIRQCRYHPWEPETAA